MQCGLVLDNDLSVSRVHCVFEIVNNELLRVTDSKSRFGTFVNGIKCSPSLDVKDGDVVKIGEAMSTFKMQIRKVKLWLTSSLTGKEKATIAAKSLQLDISSVIEDATHVVCSKSLIASETTLLALVEQKIFVTKEWLEEFAKGARYGDIPDPNNYRPVLEKSGFAASQASSALAKSQLQTMEDFDLTPRVERKSLFLSLSMIFVPDDEAQQLGKTILLMRQGGAAALAFKSLQDKVALDIAKKVPSSRLENYIVLTQKQYVFRTKFPTFNWLPVADLKSVVKSILVVSTENLLDYPTATPPPITEIPATVNTTEPPLKRMLPPATTMERSETTDSRSVSPVIGNVCSVIASLLPVIANEVPLKSSENSLGKSVSQLPSSSRKNSIFPDPTLPPPTSTMRPIDRSQANTSPEPPNRSLTNKIVQDSTLLVGGAGEFMERTPRFVPRMETFEETSEKSEFLQPTTFRTTLSSRFIINASHLSSSLLAAMENSALAAAGNGKGKKRKFAEFDINGADDDDIANREVEMEKMRTAKKLDVAAKSALISPIKSGEWLKPLNVEKHTGGRLERVDEVDGSIRAIVIEEPLVMHHREIPEFDDSLGMSVVNHKKFRKNRVMKRLRAEPISTDIELAVEAALDTRIQDGAIGKDAASIMEAFGFNSGPKKITIDSFFSKAPRKSPTKPTVSTGLKSNGVGAILASGKTRPKANPNPKRKRNALIDESSEEEDEDTSSSTSESEEEKKPVKAVVKKIANSNPPTVPQPIAKLKLVSR